MSFNLSRMKNRSTEIGKSFGGEKFGNVSRWWKKRASGVKKQDVRRPVFSLFSSFTNYLTLFSERESDAKCQCILAKAETDTLVMAEVSG